MLVTMLSLLVVAAETSNAAALVFSGLERQLIVSYYEAQRSVVRYPPDSSEPAVKRGKRLPGPQAKAHLPDALEARLPALPPGYERAVVDGWVVLLDKPTQTVRDVLGDVVVTGD
jgi:hypothetical protein